MPQNILPSQQIPARSADNLTGPEHWCIVQATAEMHRINILIALISHEYINSLSTNQYTKINSLTNNCSMIFCHWKGFLAQRSLLYANICMIYVYININIYYTCTIIKRTYKPQKYSYLIWLIKKSFSKVSKSKRSLASTTC